MYWKDSQKVSPANLECAQNFFFPNSAIFPNKENLMPIDCENIFYANQNHQQRQKRLNSVSLPPLQKKFALNLPFRDRANTFPDCQYAYSAYHSSFKQNLMNSTEMMLHQQQHPIDPFTKNCSQKRELGKVEVILENRSLWRKFNKYNTEMILTKTGRRIFPSLIFSLEKLKPDSLYSIYVDIIPADNCLWKYDKGRWISTRSAQNLPNYGRIHHYNDSPNKGSYFNGKTINFDKLKITNNRNEPINGAIILNSMHRYQPRLHIVEMANEKEGNEKNLSYNFYVFPETQFICVTAYQNPDVTQLKIDHNPFAKAFRNENIEGRKRLTEIKSMVECDSSTNSKIDVQFSSYSDGINPSSQNTFLSGINKDPSLPSSPHISIKESDTQCLAPFTLASTSSSSQRSLSVSTASSDPINQFTLSNWLLGAERHQSEEYERECEEYNNVFEMEDSSTPEAGLNSSRFDFNALASTNKEFFSILDV